METVIILKSFKWCDVCGKLLSGKQQRFCSKTCSNHNYQRYLKHCAMDAYGKSCLVCGEVDIDMLTLHHSLFDGKKHREEIGVSSGNQFNLWLKNNNYPMDIGLVVLCNNHHGKEHAEHGKPKYNGGEI